MSAAKLAELVRIQRGEPAPAPAPVLSAKETNARLVDRLLQRDPDLSTLTITLAIPAAGSGWRFDPS